MSRRPDLFIVGAPKSGTTSLYEYLAGHPAVFMSPVKEPLYFCPDVGTLHRRRLAYPADEAAYLALFADAQTEARLGEASTRYLASHMAPQLIATFAPRPYIVAMLRNPVDMVHALHNERVSQGHEEITDFEQALAADAARQVAERGQDTRHPVPASYRESGRYAEQLERWFSAIGRDRVHVIVFDDFAADTGAELSRLFEFLEIDPTYRPASLAPRNVSHRQRAGVRRVVDSRAGEWLTEVLLPRLIGTNARARLALKFRQSRLNRRRATRTAMPEHVRLQLEDEFRPQIERLSELLDRDFVALWLERRAVP